MAVRRVVTQDEAQKNANRKASRKEFMNDYDAATTLADVKKLVRRLSKVVFGEQ